MRPFVECIGCGGLKRPESARCPHCRRWFPSNNPLRRGLALLGFGTLAACCLQVSGDETGETTGSAFYSPDAYGAPPFFHSDSGPVNFGMDAYGAPPFLEDAGPGRGPPDVGDGGDPN